MIEESLNEYDSSFDDHSDSSIISAECAQIQYEEVVKFKTENKNLLLDNIVNFCLELQKAIGNEQQFTEAELRETPPLSVVNLIRKLIKVEIDNICKGKEQKIKFSSVGTDSYVDMYSGQLNNDNEKIYKNFKWEEEKIDSLNDYVKKIRSSVKEINNVTESKVNSIKKQCQLLTNQLDRKQKELLKLKRLKSEIENCGINNKMAMEHIEECKEKAKFVENKWKLKIKSIETTHLRVFIFIANRM